MKHFLHLSSFLFISTFFVIYLLFTHAQLLSHQDDLSNKSTEVSYTQLTLTLNSPPDSIIQKLIDQVSDTNLFNSIQLLQNFRTRFQDTDSSRAASQWIHDKLSLYNFDEVEFDSFHYEKPPWPDSVWDFRNIVATKFGEANTERIVILGGHYDSISWDPECNPDTLAPGADDNASGVAAILEIARILQKIELSKTVKIILFAAEEWGRLGSKFFSMQARQDSLDIELMINLDMIAHEVTGVWNMKIITNDESIEYAQLMASVAEQFTDIAPEIEMEGMFGSDHRPFWQEGYKAIWGFENDFFEMLHTCSDIVDSLNIPYLNEVTRMALATVLTVAGMPGTDIDIDEHQVSPLKTFILRQNYPNPFNPTTSISFSIPGDCDDSRHAVLSIYDLRGRRVKTLIDSDLDPGNYRIVWDGRNDREEAVSSGVYFYTIKSENHVATRKMTVAR